jgi:hypothetical protein
MSWPTSRPEAAVIAAADAAVRVIRLRRQTPVRTAAEPATSERQVGCRDSGAARPKTPTRRRRTGSPELAAELRAGVARDGHHPPPRIPAGDDATEFAGEAATVGDEGPAQQAQAADPAGAGGRHDILAAAAHDGRRIRTRDRRADDR